MHPVVTPETLQLVHLTKITYIHTCVSNKLEHTHTATPHTQPNTSPRPTPTNRDILKVTQVSFIRKKSHKYITVGTHTPHTHTHTHTTQSPIRWGSDDVI